MHNRARGGITISMKRRNEKRGGLFAPGALCALLAALMILCSAKKERETPLPELLPLVPEAWMNGGRARSASAPADSLPSQEAPGETPGGAEAAEGSPEDGVRLGSRFVTVSIEGNPVRMELEDYTVHVTAGEMPVSAEPAALAAQAAAARTFTVRRITGSAKCRSGCDVCTDAGCCQAYKSDEELRALWGEKYEENIEKIRAAVRMTEGLVLTYQGEPISAAYHSSSGERTASALEVFSFAVPYLISVESPEGALAEGGVARFTFAEAEALIKQEMPEAEFDGSHSVTVLGRSESGRATVVSFEGADVSAGTLRRALKLKSTAFTAEVEDGELVFTCTGYGHGVGMSQTGAEAMAAAGADFSEILAHYYPGTELEKLIFGE